MNEDRLSSQISDIAQLAKENKQIDAAALIANALQNSRQNMVSAKAKRWAYLASIGVPPIGLLFAIRYYFGEEDDAYKVANVCVALTAVSIISFFLLMKVFLSSSGTSVQQIEQITPSQIQQLTR